MSKEFKVGDKVRVLEDASRGQFIKGCIYEVSSVYEEDGDTRIGVVADSNGETNGWLTDNFELVESFNDLIDIAVRAQKYGLINNIRIDSKDQYLSFVDKDNGLIGWDKNQIINCIDYINSLYAETFVIESEEDMGRLIYEYGTAKLPNGLDVPLYELTDILPSVRFKILKGATVTQKRS